jgi:manganese/zinc/iron transport system substrate-binding protein
MISRSYPFAVVAVLCGVLLGCSSGPPEFKGQLPVRVVATTTMVADLVQRVGGDRVSVEVLMRPGVDPHKYQASIDDRKKLEAAHLVFFNGLHLEGKMTDTFEKSRGRIRGHAVTIGIDHNRLLKADVDGGEHDPHVWFDVSLWSQTVPVVADALSTLDPAGQSAYAANARAYQAELAELDKEVRAEVAKLPEAKRKLVTSHDAFGYFGRAYGFEVRGLQGVSTASESGTKDVQELVNYLANNRIPAVFTETSVPDAGLKTVLDTCASDRKHVVRLIGGDAALYSDALGEPGTPGATYPGMIRHNVKTIVDALSK